jgi:hypothetical protein
LAAPERRRDQPCTAGRKRRRHVGRRGAAELAGSLAMSARCLVGNLTPGQQARNGGGANDAPGTTNSMFVAIERAQAGRRQ